MSPFTERGGREEINEPLSKYSCRQMAESGEVPLVATERCVNSGSGSRGSFLKHMISRQSLSGQGCWRQPAEVSLSHSGSAQSDAGSWSCRRGLQAAETWAGGGQRRATVRGFFRRRRQVREAPRERSSAAQSAGRGLACLLCPGERGARFRSPVESGKEKEGKEEQVWRLKPRGESLTRLEGLPRGFFNV